MDKTNLGWINGLMGVVIFAGSMPATRMAVMDFTPEFLTGARAVIAGILGLICLIIFSNIKPNLQQIGSLIIVAIGVVIGFPLFTALALQTISSAHALIFIALLPLSTAIFSVVRTGEKPSLKFWLFALLGSSFVMSFMLFNGQRHRPSIGDLYIILSIIFCGLGYAEGGKLSKELGGWQVICWALVIALPFMLLFSLYYYPVNFDQVKTASLLGLLYVAIFSMLIGFFFWYKGLALGGIAKVGQIQLLQPFIGLSLSALLLGEHVSTAMICVSIAVVICVAMAKKFA